MITRTFKLCLNAGTGSAPFINVSQTDKDEVWLFELYTETGERYIPSSGAIIGIKSDGHGIANTGTVDSEGRVVITETEQMTAAAGRSIFELSIDGLTHGTANFIVNVEKKPIDGAIMSDSDLSLISQAVDSAAVIVDVIGDGDPSEVIGEHVDAWLDNHPEATTTVLDGAITAPKINSTLWDKLLVSEEASGAVASFDDGADDVPVSSLKVNLEPIQTGSGDPSPSNVRPIVASNGKNLLNIHDASGWTIPSGGELSVSGETVSMKILASGSTRYTLNQHLEGNKTVAITFTSSKGYGRFFVALRKMDDSGWMTNSDASIEGMTYNQYYDGWFTYFSDTSASQTITIPNCLYWQFGLGYGNNGVVTGETETISNPMIRLASITDSSYQPYQGIMVTRTGRNLYPIAIGRDTWVNNASGTHSTDNDILTVNVTTATSSGVYSHSSAQIWKLTPTLTGTYSYSLSAKASANGNYLIGFTGAGRETKAVTTQWQRYTFTGTFDGTEKPFVIYGMSTAGTIEIKDFMLELGSEAHEYVPYASASYPYTLGQSVYGGTVDLATGVLTVNRVLATFNGSENWTKSSSAMNGFYLYTQLRNKFGCVLVSDRFIYTPNSSVYFANYGYCYSDGAINISIDPSIGGSTVADFKTWLSNNNVQVVYELNEPQTYNLTPTEVKTLLGYNNISSTGTVDVIYHADTKLYVDKMTAVDNNIIAPTEEGFTATRNYTVNDLVIVNDTLYKVTSNIQNGGTITPNSNVQQTTLGALIKALS